MGSQHSTENRHGEGLSRRELIARGAVAGGLIWTTPLILESAAAATTAGCSPAPCVTYYYGKFKVVPGTASNWAAAGCTVTPSGSSTGTDAACSGVNPPVAGKTWSTVPSGAICFGQVGGVLTVSINPTGPLKNCQMLQVMSKKRSGPSSCQVEYSSAVPACKTSQGLTWPNPSHVTVWICCPS